MPELPEVETTVRGLRKHIVDKTIISVWTDPQKPTKSHDDLTWNKRRRLIEGQKIKSVTRRAKYIVVNLKDGGSIFIHQKMTGHLLVGKWKMEKGEWRSLQTGAMEDSKNQHIRLMLTLDKNNQVALSDTRRFATITYVRDPAEHIHLRKLGPEPLDISMAGFHGLFNGKRGRLKPILMDPHFIVGIGNIYADEILWASGLHPLSRVESLKESDRRAIWNNTRLILAKAIKLGGSSVDDYRTSEGETGGFQNLLHAYQQTGKLCGKKDGGSIERIVVGQRSTHFCPVHQIKR